MNERIRQLAEQAGYTEGYYASDDGPWIESEFNKEKFAELIVRECAELTLDYKNDAHYNGWLDYRDEIKKHFGVE